jgi:hypothetical protein
MLSSESVLIVVAGGAAPAERGSPRAGARVRQSAPPRVDSSTASGIASPRAADQACAAICGPTTVTSGIGCSAHRGGSTPAASAAMRAQWRSKPAGVQTST